MASVLSFPLPTPSSQPISSSLPKPASASASSSKPIDPSQTLVYHTLLLLLAFTALYALSQLPRAWVRGESGTGWVLWFSRSSSSSSSHGSRAKDGYPYSGEGVERERERGRDRRRRHGRQRDVYPPNNVPVDVRDDDDDLDLDLDPADEKPTHRHHHHQYTHRRRLPHTLNLPTHVPALPPLLSFLSAPLSSAFPLLPSYSSSQALVLALYTIPWTYTLLTHSNPLTDPLRSGFVCIAQLPLVVSLAAKNGAVGWVLGGGVGGMGAGGGAGSGGWEKVNWLHRWAGRGVVGAGWLHCWHYFYQWTLNGTFKKNIASSANAWGMVGFIALNAMFVFSLKGVRERAYNLFLWVHIVGFGVLLFAIFKHKPPILTYILAATFIYSLDHLLRLVKTRYATAYITPLPELEMTRVAIPGINRGWRAGQHVRLRVLVGGGMGWGGWMEVHPFTIASVAGAGGSGGEGGDGEGEEGGEGEGIILMCKRTGKWTRNLYELAKLGGYSSNIESGTSRAGQGKGGRQVRVLVEGPYGGPGTTNYASFSAAVLICGGSGVTYALGVIKDLVRKDCKGRCRVKVVELVWIVPDPACLAPLLPTFTDLIRQSVFTPLRISVFYTRAPTGKQPAYFDAVDASPFAASPPTPTTSPSPNISRSSSNPAGNGNSVTFNLNIATYTSPNPNPNINPNTNDTTRHRSHTLIAPVSDDTQAFAQAYQQRLEQQRSARSRPPPSRRPSSPYEAPRTAPAPPSAYPHPSNTAQVQPKSGPQRQDSNASAKTLVDSSLAHKSSLKRTPTYGSSTRYLPQGLTLAPGRPKLAKFLDHAIQRATALSHANPKDDDARGGGGRLSGMAVGVCGPVGLARDVRDAVGCVEGVRRRQVGGVEVVEEVFGS